MQYQLIKQPREDYSPIEQILVNRGIPYDEINHYLLPSPMDDLAPTLLDYIEEAAEMLLKHLDDKIFMTVDSDCDGYTSAALLLNYLYVRFPSCIKNITYIHHEGKQHGIEVDKIPEGTKLVIALDASSNEYDIHKSLYDQGIDVLILDHHEASEVSAYACVVNNQLCGYPTKSLSGVGIVYKFCQFLDSLFGNYVADDFIDIVALGTIGDVMDLRDIETHYLTQLGLSNIRNPFIVGMINKNSYSIGPTLSPISIAFYVVPLINAVARVGTMEEKQLLFESMLEWKAYEEIPSTKRGHKGEQETRIEQCLRTCTNVKNHQTKEQDVAVAQIDKIIEDENLNDHKVLIIRVENPNYNKAVVGLIANKVAGNYCKPVILVSKSENGEWSGSARGCVGVDNLKSLVQESGLSSLAEGHQGAFGVAFVSQNYEALQNYLDNALKDIEFTTNYKVDYIFKPYDNIHKFIMEIGDYKCLWGQNVDEPLIAVEGIKVTKDMLTLMARDRNPTLKISLPNDVSCIKFKSSEEELKSLESEGCTNINIVAKCEINRYLNSAKPQLIIQDYEIIDKQQFYF